MYVPNNEKIIIKFSNASSNKKTFDNFTLRMLLEFATDRHDYCSF